MEKASQGDGSCQPLPPQSPVNPLNVKPEHEHGDRLEHTIMERPGFGKSGQPISLLTNYFKVSIEFKKNNFHQYIVSINPEKKKKEDVKSKATRRKVVDKFFQTYYSSQLPGKRFAYDGERYLYTVDLLPRNKLAFPVALEESIVEDRGESGKRGKRSPRSKSFNVEITYVKEIPLRPIPLAGQQINDPEQLREEALNVLNVILRQQAANRGCLLVRQSFFYDDSRYFTDIGGGVTSCRGIHSCFQHTRGGLSLNTDVSTTMILTPGPVIDFLLAYKDAKKPSDIDWGWAEKMLKNMRVKTSHSKMEFKIIGLSENPCNKQFFSMKVKTVDGAHEGGETVEVTVYDYFTKYRKIRLSSSAACIPCLDVGKPNQPTYLPLELCSLVSLQRYTNSLSDKQRSLLSEKSSQKPEKKIRVINQALENCDYNRDPLLAACGISIKKTLSLVHGRVLEAPKLKVGEDVEFTTSNGRWNFNEKQLQNPARIERWVVVNFSARCDTRHFSRELINCGKDKGIHINPPLSLIEEDAQHKRADPVIRVEKMFEQITSKYSDLPQLLLCVLPVKKNCEIYGPWKKKSLSDVGVVTQCISPDKISNQYLTNVLLKINSKLGGINSLLAIERDSSFPVFKNAATMILGMDVSHGSSGRSDFPSIAAVVGSTSGPLFSRYRASVRAQSPKVEIIESLYKPLENGEDGGIMRELLMGFSESNGCMPEQIIVFRDGVSESQFPHVLDIELDQMKKAYEHLGGVGLPKFTVIIAQKIHHTKLFRSDGKNENVRSGTVVDREIVHPRNYDFYMCSHAGTTGTSRPAHYHVLIDEIGFSPDQLERLIHYLSYVYQISTSAISIVAPVHYAHLAALQMGKFIKFGDLSVHSDSVPELPRLHDNVAGSMFFC